MKRTLTFAAAAAALAIAGCGGGSSNSSSSSSAASAPPAPATTPTTAAGGSSGGASSNLKVSADPSGALKFNKSSLSAKSGNVTITMNNPSSVPHGIGVTGNGLDKDGQVVNKGGNSTVSVSLKPGKYTFYCPVPGHRQAGMEGTLTVK
jgi:plastocyanin